MKRATLDIRRAAHLIPILLFLVCGVDEQLIAQYTAFFPDIDTLAIWGTCTPPGIMWTASADSPGVDRVVIRPVNGELVQGAPPDHITARYDSAYFLVHDSLQRFSYSFWCTQYSPYHPGRFNIPPDSIEFILDGPFAITLFVMEDSILVDSSRRSWVSYQTGLGVQPSGLSIAREALLQQNYPNPFNPSTRIGYRVQGTGDRVVTLKVYDILGREVATLVNERKAPGNYEVRFDASGLSSGVYVYRLTAGEFSQSRKMLVLK